MTASLLDDEKQRRIAAWGLDDTTQEGEEACCDKENVEAS